MKTIMFLSHKGGVGKTTCAFQTAFGLPFVLSGGELPSVEHPNVHSRVLLIDLDEQCELSQRIVNDYQSSPEYLAANGFRTLLDFISVTGDETTSLTDALRACVLHTGLVDVILGSYDGESVMAMFDNNPKLLRERLALLSKEYDVCILDSPPGRVSAQTAGILACDYAFPCSDEHDGGLRGVRDAINDVNTANAQMGGRVAVPLVMVRKDSVPFDEEAWYASELKKITKVEPFFLRYDPMLLREVAKTGNLLYTYSQKTLARQFAYFCVQIVGGLLRQPLRQPGFPPFTAFYVRGGK